MSFRKFSTTLLRFGVGTLDNGRYTNGASTPSTITVGIQQPKPKELALLPEGKRNSKAYIVFADTEIKLTSNDGTNADWILIDGEYYEAQAVKRYRTMYPKTYRALCTKIENTEDVPTP